MTEKQYMAARLAELRDIAKRAKSIEDKLDDILELLKIYTYGNSDKGVQETWSMSTSPCVLKCEKTLDDICEEIVRRKKCSDS